MKVLLVFPRMIGDDPRYAPPLGIAYLASALEKAEHEVSILDQNVELLNKPEFENLLKLLRPELVGISAMTTTFPETLETMRIVRRTIECKILLGGPHPTALPGEAF